jgi:hypothetical protein
LRHALVKHEGRRRVGPADLSLENARPDLFGIVEHDAHEFSRLHIGFGQFDVGALGLLPLFDERGHVDTEEVADRQHRQQPDTAAGRDTARSRAAAILDVAASLAALPSHGGFLRLNGSGPGGGMLRNAQVRWCPVNRRPGS